MYKIIEQYKKEFGCVIYTVLDANNERMLDFTDYESAQMYVQIQEVKEGKGCNV